MRVLLVSIAIAMALGAKAGAADSRPTGEGVEAYYARWLQARAECFRKGTYTKATDAACDRMMDLSDVLETKGWCFGGEADHNQWHICNARDRAEAYARSKSAAESAELDRQEAANLRAMSAGDRALLLKWMPLYRACANVGDRQSCGAAARIESSLRKHAWCRYSEVDRASDRWHRCRRGDFY